MSGGRYDYAYRTVEDFAERFDATTPERAAFRQLLDKVARAMHDIEWVDDGDYGDGDEMKAIMDCISPSDVQEMVLLRLRETVELAQAILTKAGT